MPQSDEITTAIDFCREILPAVSRTFSLSIRLLPGDLGAAVRCAYLLCRIADTIEDEPQLPAEDKASLLRRASDVLRRSPQPRASSRRARRTHHREGGAPASRRTTPISSSSRIARSRQRHAQHVRHWVREMIAGMRKFVLAYPHGVRIQTLDEYKEYCYYVAGTVGYPAHRSVARALAEHWRATVRDASRAHVRLRRGAADGEHPEGRCARRGA